MNQLKDWFQKIKSPLVGLLEDPVSIKSVVAFPITTKETPKKAMVIDKHLI